MIPEPEPLRIYRLPATVNVQNAGEAFLAFGDAGWGVSNSLVRLCQPARRLTVDSSR